ncbi:hypothetical protein FRC00_010979 [Tulasnella sp. 408]|nr:hypothetical protein FRC00_010979 [Tulasnella sp. 408]
MADMKTSLSIGNQYYVGELCPIARLPTELLVAILLVVLPNIDAVTDSQQCHEYMTHLYALRSVSKKWRGVIDGTPILWRLISSTLPLQVNATSVSRSLNAPLVVIYDMILPDEYSFRYNNSSQELQSAISSARSFAEWADVVRHRWSSATFKLVSSVAPELLAKPAPQLRSITIVLHGGSLVEIPSINLLGGCTGKIRHVKIERAGYQGPHIHHIQMFWPRGAFQGLKSLHFGYIRSASFTTRYILEVLGASPELETLVLKGNIVQRDQDDPELPQVVLSRLQTLQYVPHYDGELDQTLRHVTLLPDSVKNLSITDYNFTSQYTPTYQSPAHVSWDGRLKDPRFRFFISTISPSTVLQWTDQILSLAGPGITLSLAGKSLCEDVLSTMKSMKCIDKIIVYEHFGQDIPYLQRLLDAFGQADSTSPGSASSVTFPSLHTLQIADWDAKLDSVVGMLRTRFSRPSDQDDARRPPDLSLTLSCRRRVRDQDHGADNIPSLELVEGMRVMPGLKEVRLGNVYGAGVLAVVWDEGLRTPVWG